MSTSSPMTRTFPHPDERAGTTPDRDDGGEIDTATGLGGRRRGTMLERALTVLDSFAARSVLGVSEVTALTGLPKSTSHRMLVALVELGYLVRIGDRYGLSGRLFELGNQIRPCRPGSLRDRAVPFMIDLLEQTGETIHLAIVEDADVLYVEKIFSHRSTRCATAIGHRHAAHATALGKALLAFGDPARLRDRLARTGFPRLTPFTIDHPMRLLRTLQQVRQDGYATDSEEWQLGLASLAVPVLDPRTNLAVAALSVTRPAAGRSVLVHRDPLLRAAQRLSAQLF